MTFCSNMLHNSLRLQRQRESGLGASMIQVMSRERVRRCITFFLLILLAAVALRGGEGKDVALTLGPIVALLVIAMRFYFPARSQKKTPPRGGELAA
jgi:multisubunit Na+/H+ antiporter MnhB subunit